MANRGDFAMASSKIGTDYHVILFGGQAEYLSGPKLIPTFAQDTLNFLDGKKLGNFCVCLVSLSTK